MRIAATASLVLYLLLGGAPALSQQAETGTTGDDTIVVTGRSSRAEPSVAPPAAIADARAEPRHYLTPAESKTALRTARREKGARIVADDAFASGREIGRPCAVVRRIRLRADDGNSVMLISDSAPAWPFRQEAGSFAVDDLAKALDRLERDGAEIVAAPFTAGEQDVAMIRTRDGQLFEVHGPRSAADSGWRARLIGSKRRYAPIETDRRPLPGMSTVGSHVDAGCGTAPSAGSGQRAGIRKAALVRP